MKIRTTPLLEVTVAKLRRMRQVVDLSPPYQREGSVWQTSTSQKLIDSIINGLDVPKLYFEREHTKRMTASGQTMQYAVLDGKQRLEATLAFLDDELSLPDDFIYFEDPAVKAAGMKLSSLQLEHPVLARTFLEFELPIVVVQSDSGDLIEELFQRLNASSALNAAERRNAISGPTRDAANSLAEHTLLVERAPIKSARYKYRELAAKFLAIEHQLATRGRLTDTKSDTLYALFMATSTRGKPPTISRATMEGYRAAAGEVLVRMEGVFESDDALLGSIGTVVVYYLVFRDSDVVPEISRERLSRFEDLRRHASRLSEDDPAYGRSANARLREYNVFVQSTNDGRALERRAQILSAFLSGYSESDPLAALDELGDGEVPETEEPEG